MVQTAYSWPGKSKLKVLQRAIPCNSSPRHLKEIHGRCWTCGQDKWKMLVHYEDSKIQQFYQWLTHHVTVTLAFHSLTGETTTGGPTPVYSQTSRVTTLDNDSDSLKQSASHVGTASLCNYGGSFAQHYLLKVQYKKSPKLASELIFIKKDIVDNEHVELST